LVDNHSDMVAWMPRSACARWIQRGNRSPEENAAHSDSATGQTRPIRFCKSQQKTLVRLLATHLRYSNNVGAAC